MIVREGEAAAAPAAFARFDAGVEKSASLANMGEEEVEGALRDLVFNSGASSTVNVAGRSPVVFC